jgi:hypothetical protein
MADEHRDNGSDRNRRAPREDFDPTDVELLPRRKCSPCSVEIGFAAPNRNDRLIERVTGRLVSNDANRAVRELHFLRITQEAVDHQLRRAPCHEHECLKVDWQTVLHGSTRPRRSRTFEPAKLLEHGFTFKYPDWRSAARDLCHQWKGGFHKARAA